MPLGMHGRLVQIGFGGEEMKITIVYESMFGNTHEVATAISDGVRKAEAGRRCCMRASCGSCARADQIHRPAGRGRPYPYARHDVRLQPQDGSQRGKA